MGTIVVDNKAVFIKQKMANFKTYLNNHDFFDDDLDAIAEMSGLVMLMAFNECLVPHKEHVMKRDMQYFQTIATSGGKFHQLLGRCLQKLSEWMKEGHYDQVAKVWLYIELFCELSDHQH